ncbi:hypothetical protein Tco_0932803, partial [Tanacetum coccineum]
MLLSVCSLRSGKACVLLRIPLVRSCVGGRVAGGAGFAYAIWVLKLGGVGSGQGGNWWPVSCCWTAEVPWVRGVRKYLVWESSGAKRRRVRRAVQSQHEPARLRGRLWPVWNYSRFLVRAGGKKRVGLGCSSALARWMFVRLCQLMSEMRVDCGGLTGSEAGIGVESLVAVASSRKWEWRAGAEAGSPHINVQRPGSTLRERTEHDVYAPADAVAGDTLNVCRVEFAPTGGGGWGSDLRPAARGVGEGGEATSTTHARGVGRRGWVPRPGAWSCALVGGGLGGSGDEATAPGRRRRASIQGRRREGALLNGGKPGKEELHVEESEVLENKQPKDEDLWLTMRTELDGMTDERIISVRVVCLWNLRSCWMVSAGVVTMASGSFGRYEYYLLDLSKHSICYQKRLSKTCVYLPPILEPRVVATWAMRTLDGVVLLLLGYSGGA